MTDEKAKNNSNPEFYKVGGTMNANAPSYVWRKADDKLLEGLKAGNLCYVLTSSQMGKSSLMSKTISKLKKPDFAVVKLDLTSIGENLDAEQWYDGIQLQIGEQLNIEDELDQFWQANKRLGPLQRWLKAMREVVLERCEESKIVIFIDEVNVVHSLKFSTSEFFAGIRSIYNNRNEDSQLNRLNFCLIGVTTTSDLIKNVQTAPLNIGGQRIELTDFNESEVEILADNLGRDSQINKKLLKRILYWTGGHPYLTQKFCKEVSDNIDIKSENDIDNCCQRLFLSPGARDSEENLVYVRDRMLNSDEDKMGLLTLYLKIYKGKRVLNDNLNPFTKTFRLSGITRPKSDDSLAIRNRIYQKVFDETWVEANMPDAELKKQRIIYRKRLAGITMAATIMAFLAIFSGVQWVKANKALEELGVTKESLDIQAKQLKVKDGEIVKKEKTINEQNENLGRQKIEIESQTRKLEEREDQLKVRDGEIVKKEKTINEQNKDLAEQRKQLKIQTNIANIKTQEANDLLQVANKESEKGQHFLYAADVKSAETYYKKGDFDSYFALLNSYADEDMKIKTDRLFPDSSISITDKMNPLLRGFEWNYLWHVSQGLVKFNDVGSNIISSLAYSPNERYLVSSNNPLPLIGPPSLILWDVAKGRMEKQLLAGDEVYWADCAFSNDGKWFASIGAKGHLNFWKSDSWERFPIVSPIKENGSNDIETFLKFKFTLDNDYLLTVSSIKSKEKTEKDIVVRRWRILSNLRDGSSPFVLDETFSVSLSTEKKWIMHISPEESHLIVGSNEMTSTTANEIKQHFKAALFDFVKGKENELNLELDYSNSLLTKLSEHGDRMVIVYQKQGTFLNPQIEAIFFDVKANRIIDKRLLENESKMPVEIALSVNTELMAVSGSGGGINIYDSQGFIKTIPQRKADSLFAFAFSPNGEQIAVGGQRFEREGSIGILGLFNTRLAEDVFSINEEFLTLSPDETKIVTRGKQNDLTVWDTVGKRPIKFMDLPKAEYADFEVRFSPDSKYFIIYTQGSNFRRDKIRLWNAITGREVTLEQKNGFCSVSDRKVSTFSSNSNLLATTCGYDKIRLWHTESGQELPFFFETTNYVSALRFLQNDKILLGVKTGIPGIASTERHMYNLETGSEIPLPEGYVAKQGEYISKVSLDGKWLIIEDLEKRNVFLSDGIKREFIGVRSENHNIFDFSTNGKFLVIFEKGRGRVKDLLNHKEIALDEVKNGNKSVYSAYMDVVFSPSGRWMVLDTRQSEKIPVWEIGTGSATIINNYGFKGGLRTIEFSNDGTRLLLGYNNGDIRLWDPVIGRDIFKIERACKVTDYLKKLILTKDNQRLIAILSRDGIKIWNTQFRNEGK